MQCSWAGNHSESRLDLKAHRFNAYRAKKILFILSGDEADQADCIQRSFLSPAFNWLAKIAFLERLLVIVGVFALKQSKMK